MSAHYRTEVAFADTDASGWMHFPNVFRYFEAAEHRYLRERGVVVIDREQGGWPRVNAQCDYLRPLHLADAIEVQLEVAKIGTTSLTWAFEIIHLASGETAAKGRVTTVRVGPDAKPLAITSAERGALLCKA